LAYCSKQLGLQGLSRLAASSKCLRKASLAATCRDAPLLLLDTAKAAAKFNKFRDPATQLASQQNMEAVAWLLPFVPAAATSATTAAQMLSVPNVPLQLAEQLVAAGMRLSFPQITAAARRMIAGVEVWMQAQLDDCRLTDIPRAAIELCASPLWVSCQMLRWMMSCLNNHSSLPKSENMLQGSAEQ
jgi:hypothetical protein